MAGWSRCGPGNRAQETGIVKFLPQQSVHRILYLVLVAAFLLTCIEPPYPEYFYLEHVPTVPALVLLVILERRLQMSRLSFVCIALFLALHFVGARYLYSNVPYDEWCEALFGWNLTEQLGLRRNHYDRLVHFLFGLLISFPAYRFFQRILELSHGWSMVFTLQFILAVGGLYEVAEWGVAMIFEPEAAEAYNGQQGDVWDPQRDMLLAAVGAVISLAAIQVVRWRSASINSRSA